MPDDRAVTRKVVAMRHVKPRVSARWSGDTNNF